MNKNQLMMFSTIIWFIYPRDPPGSPLRASLKAIEGYTELDNSFLDIRRHFIDTYKGLEPTRLFVARGSRRFVGITGRRMIVKNYGPLVRSCQVFSRMDLPSIQLVKFDPRMLYLRSVPRLLTNDLNA